MEDDEHIRTLLTSLLEDEGYRILAADSAEQALRLLNAEHRRPNMLLLDYDLGRGGMNGISLFDLLLVRFGWWDIPALMVSAELPPQRELTQRSLRSMDKPFDIYQLLSVIEEMLKKAGQQPAIFL